MPPASSSAHFKVAVVGGGTTAGALAIALLQAARVRAKPIEVQVFEGDGPKDGSLAPAILSPECRSRLAGLGCRLPPSWKVTELSEIEVVSRNRSVVLPAPATGLWVVDDWPSGRPGQRLLSSHLKQIALSHGASLIARRVDSVEVTPRIETDPPPPRLVVRSGGRPDRFDAAALATGSNEDWNGRFFRGFKGPPTVAAIQARLLVPGSSRVGSHRAHLLWSPGNGIDGLLLVPCGGSIYALGFGEEISASDLCQTLMSAARDGFLPEGFEIAALVNRAIPNGAGSALVAEGRVAVGSSAFGHPFQLGISEVLASCTRAAVALVEQALDHRSLEKRYVQEGIEDLISHARAGSGALRWLKRAGPDAALAFAKAKQATTPAVPFRGGILGLSSPTASALQSASRRLAVIHWLSSLIDSAICPLPPSAPIAQPGLIYLVDDDPLVRDGLAGLLSEWGLSVVSFSDELALYAAAARQRPDAILLDVVLSWVDGLSLCEGLKGHPSTRDCRVVVMTGLNRPHLRSRALEAGADEFLAKPVDRWELVAALGLGPLFVQPPSVSANGGWSDCAPRSLRNQVSCRLA